MANFIVHVDLDICYLLSFSSDLVAKHGGSRKLAFLSWTIVKVYSRILHNSDSAMFLKLLISIFREETHKNDILQFSSLHSAESINNIQLMDRQSTALIWDFLALLVRQNGVRINTNMANILID